MNNFLESLSIGVVGSLVATVLAAIIIVIFRNLFSSKRYLKNQKGRLEEIKRYSTDINLLYIATLRDLVIMNVLFFADSALWNMGEVLVFSEVLQRNILLINNLGIFSIRSISVVVLIVGLWIAINAINRINRVLAYQTQTGENSQ